MNSPIFIALACGAASALMYASVGAQNVVALALFVLAPLPVFVAGLGWRATAAIAAGVTGAGLLAVLTNPYGAAGYGLMVAATPAVLSHFALLSRTSDTGVIEWYPQDILAAIAILLAGAAAAATLAIAGAHTPEFKQAMLAFFEGVKLRDMLVEANVPADQIDRVFRTFTDVFTPLMAGAALSVAHLVSLWLAAEVLAVSGRLPRPPFQIASLRLPQTMRLAALASVGLTFAPDPIDFYALCFVGALVSGYFILGAVVIWALTERAPARPLVLLAVFAFVFLLVWPIPLIAVVGMADQIFHLRERFAAPPPSHP
jgi:hypothetical protein